MKKMTKRIFAIIMAVAMMAAVTVTAAADDTATLTVKGVEVGATVTGYKIVQLNNGKWEVVKAGIPAIDATTNAVTAPTDEQINALIAEINSTDEEKTNFETITYTAATPAEGATTTNYTADAGPGMYLVLVTGSTGKYVYNPMVQSVDFSGENQALAAKVTNEGEVKKEEVPFDKSVSDPDTATGDNASGSSLGVGDYANFKITTTIPAYSDAYESVIFNIKDTLPAGLDDMEDIVVKIGETTYTKDTSEAGVYTLTHVEGSKTFTVAIDSDYILNTLTAATPVEITYKAKLNEQAVKVNAGTSAFGENKNTAEVEYSNNPTNSDETSKKEDETHHYTFDIDGAVSGWEGVQEGSTSEVIKVDENGNTEVLTTSTTYGDPEYTQKHPLAGAKFKLYKDDNGQKGAQVGEEVTTTNDGKMNFQRLDAGTYWLEETEAPSGYYPYPNLVKVVISATLDENGVLQSYSITINDEATSTYSLSHGEGNVTKIVRDATSETQTIKNTKTPALPSTGGIGTYVFTVAGVAIMAVAAGLLIVRRKKA